MNQEEQNPHVCVRCSQRAKTCCWLTPGEEELCFPLSEMERERILEFCDAQGAFAQQDNTKPFVDHLKRLFPTEGKLLDKLFPMNKFHMRLATRSDGSCQLLGEEGCILPREARPLYCLIFPFWFYGERLTSFTPPNCLVVSESRTFSDMFRAIGMTKAEAKTLFGRLRLSWGLPPEEGMEVLEQSFSRYSQEKKKKK